MTLTQGRVYNTTPMIWHIHLQMVNNFLYFSEVNLWYFKFLSVFLVFFSPDKVFPSGLLAIVRKIFKYLFHVQAHMYYAHFNDFANLELHSHLNTVFMNFIMFHQEFNLLDPKETAPLDDLIHSMGLGSAVTAL